MENSLYRYIFPMWLRVRLETDYNIKPDFEKIDRKHKNRICWAYKRTDELQAALDDIFEGGRHE